MTTEHSALDKVYGVRFSPEEAARLEWRRRLWGVLVKDFFSKWIPPSSTVVDYGCGLGEFINAVTASRKIAVDLRESVKTHLQPGVEFVKADQNWQSTIGDGVADVVFCSNLLEHLPDRISVTKLLKRFNQLLKRDGRVLILGPNLRYSGPAYWDFFDHILPLTHVSLVEALATGGFETEVLIPRFLPFTTVGVRQMPMFLVRCYLWMPIVWRLVGAQFFAVAKPIDPSR